MRRRHVHRPLHARCVGGTVTNPAASGTPAGSNRPIGEERELTLPSIWSCVVGLFVVALVLPRIGIERAWQLARARTPRYRVAESPDRFRALAHRVASASALCPLRSECVEQSLFILWWMRRQRMFSELCFGAVPYPFAAHAWVESAGVPVNDAPEQIARYRRLRGEWEPPALGPETETSDHRSRRRDVDTRDGGRSTADHSAS